MPVKGDEFLTQTKRQLLVLVANLFTKHAEVRDILSNNSENYENVLYQMKALNKKLAATKSDVQVIMDKKYAKLKSLSRDVKTIGNIVKSSQSPKAVNADTQVSDLETLHSVNEQKEPNLSENMHSQKKKKRNSNIVIQTDEVRIDNETEKASESSKGTHF